MIMLFSTDHYIYLPKMQLYDYLQQFPSVRKWSRPPQTPAAHKEHSLPKSSPTFDDALGIFAVSTGIAAIVRRISVQVQVLVVNFIL